VAGSGVGTGSKLIVAPATVPEPPVVENVLINVAVSVPVTSPERPGEPRNAYKAELMLPAMMLAENDDSPGAPPLRRVRLALWKDPVKRVC
jgi:hypothetical protein